MREELRRMKSVQYPVGEVPDYVYESCFRCDTWTYILSMLDIPDLRSAGEEIRLFIRKDLEEDKGLK